MILTTHPQLLTVKGDFGKFPVFTLGNLLIFISTGGIKSLTNLKIKSISLQIALKTFFSYQGKWQSDLLNNTLHFSKKSLTQNIHQRTISQKNCSIHTDNPEKKLMKHVQCC